MSESCDHNCEGCAHKCDHQQSQSLKAEMNPLSDVKKVIAVVSGKGGVGKSLVTGLLACQSKRSGLKTAILDADITGPSIPKMFGISNRAQGSEDGIFPEISKGGIELISVNLLLENASDPVLWRGPIIASVVKQFWSNVIWNEVDFMFVDMPPGTGDVALTVFQSLPIAGVVIVASPQDLVSMIVGKAIKMANMMNVPVLGLVENMSYIECPDCGKKISVFGESKIDRLAAEFDLPILARLPIDPKIAEACDAGNIESIEKDFFDAALLNSWK